MLELVDQGQFCEHMLASCIPECICLVGARACQQFIQDLVCTEGNVLVCLHALPTAAMAGCGLTVLPCGLLLETRVSTFSCVHDVE